MNNDLVLRAATKWLSPVIILFALYVQFHGDYSPGGGFQAGVIFSSAILLYALTYGMQAALQLIPEWVLRLGASLGVLLYAGVGVVAMLKGGNFLNYSVLAEEPVAGQHIGIIIIELGVGLTVASVMVLLFFTFARRVAPE
ncbi:Na(+)/H(+) antiporter subunit B [Glaciecola sp. KUL10]|uniref:Na(+)/H(+) antiporter subunit B n=1 Tax=Glaciecola sp. (strain KUL10) TaxID=2161813 RepID=UPI000D788325|nr:Na(+)/H(+) antiporter subunit B [Glaciecola sp. KUL10]GBL05872.1 Na+/H+ antiporter MnhB subunit-like protein [Glaciecola sp. KUL10]